LYGIKKTVFCRLATVALRGIRCSRRQADTLERETIMEDHADKIIFAMYVEFVRNPGRGTLPGEPVELGEIGQVEEKNWWRFIRSRLAVKISGVKFQNESPQIAFINDLEEPESQPDFW
jgi:hypothetical protein